MSKKDSGIFYISDELAAIEHGIIVSMGDDHSRGNSPTMAAGKPKAGDVKRPDDLKAKEENPSTNGVANWGESNDYPQDVILRANKDLELLPLLDKKGRLLQGKEVIALNLVFNKEKKDFDVERIDDPEINNFVSHWRFKRFWREACVDFTWFHNFWSDLIKDKAGAKIVSLGVHAAENCRWGTMNSKGVIETCYVSSYWPEAQPTDKEKVMEHPVLDPYSYSVVDDFKAQTTVDRVVWPSSYPTPGQSYYQNAPWHKYLFSQWYTLKAMIPQWRVKHMERVLSAKYILTIPVNYWKQLYPDWDRLDKDVRLKHKKAKVKEINDSLTGFNGVGSTILSEVGFDQEGKELPAFKIIPIESVKANDANLEDSQEASEYMMRSLDLDPTIVGKGPGRGKDAGSGSDKRVAFNILVALLQPYRDVILEPLYFIAEFNGWLVKYPNLRFKVLEVELETLDKSHQTSVVKNPVTKSENVAA